MTNPPSLRHVVLHTAGPGWVDGVDFREQPGVRDHVGHYATLHEQGRLEMGGPFLDGEAGGMMVTTPGMDRDEIEAFAAADPAVRSGLLEFEVRTWYVAMDRRSLG
jgi:uncharacterized protein YciI